MNKDERLIAFMVSALFTYVGIEYLIEQRRLFAEWRTRFLAPFIRHPGRREFLRDVLIAEEMHLKRRTSDAQRRTSDAGEVSDG